MFLSLLSPIQYICVLSAMYALGAGHSPSKVSLYDTYNKRLETLAETVNYVKRKLETLHTQVNNNYTNNHISYIMFHFL